MRLASIDIGTNTILMLIAEIGKDGAMEVLRDEHTIARLGKGVDEKGSIQKETFARISNILKDLRSIARYYNVDRIIACGTSALRDAKNSREFLDFIEQEVNLKINVISGIEEAELTYLGATSDLKPDISGHRYAVLDIGGGSTEISFGNRSCMESAYSIDIGSVRLTERILKQSPPDQVGS